MEFLPNLKAINSVENKPSYLQLECVLSYLCKEIQFCPLLKLTQRIKMDYRFVNEAEILNSMEFSDINTCLPSDE